MKLQGEEMTLEEIREIYDPSYWAEQHIVAKDANGDFVPFVPRWYQKETMQCTATRKVDRWGRGMGKSMAGICEELHLSLTRKKLETMIVCPQQTQAEMWYMEILAQIENSPSLNDIVAQQKQSPYYYLRFNNGSVIKIFTAGSGSGKKGGSMRGQNPRRVRLDEQDYLAEDDYNALMPLLRRFKELTFHGSSTPTGLRGMFFRMCTQLSEYREFYFPITDHPDWSDDMQVSCMEEAKTTDRYSHEFMAEFSDPTSGVFKSVFIEHAMMPFRRRDCVYNPARRYVMGVDWNGKGTGTRIAIVEYDPETRLRRKVAHSVVDEIGTTTAHSIAEVRRLNKQWMCDFIYIDAGFGAAQDELIRMEGHMAGKKDLQTYKLKNIKTIDFGGTLEFNKLVPNREPGDKVRKGDETELKRRTKPFMVEGAVMVFEQDLIELSRDDEKLLEEQLRGYRVKTWSSHDVPASYSTDADSGDHDLDAFMLALLGIEIEYGLYRTQATLRRLAHIVHVAGWGVGSYRAENGLSDSQELTPQEVKKASQERSGVASRSNKDVPATPKVVHAGRGAVVLSQSLNPGASRLGARIPSRTLGLTPRGGIAGYGSGPGPGMSPFHSVGAGIRFNR
jgi:hypothetical protein